MGRSNKAISGSQELALFRSFSQQAVARKVGQQEIHLVREDFTPLQVYVFGMGGGKWNGE
jgi:hypothetical protein